MLFSIDWSHTNEFHIILGKVAELLRRSSNFVMSDWVVISLENVVKL